MQEYWFNKEQTNAYKKYFTDHGFCVIASIIDEERIQSTISEIWENEALLNNGEIKRDDPTTWDKYWPTDDKGFLDLCAGSSEVNLRNYWMNRLDPDIVNVYKNLYEEDVLCYPDRMGVMRPTFPPGKEKWRTASGWLHLDSNPWDIKPKIQLQGLLTLTEQTETSGGFCCIPDFHKRIGDWAEAHPKTYVDDIYYFEKDSPVYNDVKKLRAPAGSLIIWDDRIPHCNYPNHNNHFRMVEYMNYYRISNITNHHAKRLMKIGVEASLLDEPCYLTQETTAEQRKLIDFEKYSNLISTDREKNGYLKFKQASVFEAEGNVNEAIKLYRAAYKMFPLCERF